MNYDLLAQIIIFSILFTVVWYVFFWIYREHTVEIFRQRMFTVRDQLFDDAADGVVPFDHPAYVILRSTMNGFIRFGHRISLFEMFIGFLIIKQAGPSFVTRLNDALKGLDPNVAERLRMHQTRMIEIVIMQSLAASPVFLVFVLSYFIPIGIFEWLKKLTVSLASELMRKPIDAMESTAFAYGR